MYVSRAALGCYNCDLPRDFEVARANGFGAVSLTPEQTATMLRFADAYTRWKGMVQAAAASAPADMAATLNNLMKSADRQLQKFLDGDMAMANALETTMTQTMALVQTLRDSNWPSLEDVFSTTKLALRDLVIGVANTAGAAAGSLIKAAADQLNVDPSRAGEGVENIVMYGAVAVGLVAVAYLVSSARAIVRR